MKSIEDGEGDSSSYVEDNQRDTAMMFNTNRDTNMETSQPLPARQPLTNAQRRDSDLQASLNEASQNIQNMNLNDDDRRILAPRRMNTSENDSETNNDDRVTTDRMNLATDTVTGAGIQRTNPSPMMSNPGINDSITNSLRDRDRQETGASTDKKSKETVSPFRILNFLLQTKNFQKLQRNLQLF